MKDIMIATSNPGKVREFRDILTPYGYSVHDLSEIEHHEVDENGTTYSENALIKAKSVNKVCNMITIADDSGLEIEAMPNQLGIHSARFMAGYSYLEKNQTILKNLEGVSNRKAKFTCAIALIDETGEHIFTGVLHGKIADKVDGSNGFGYDPIFIADGHNATNGALPIEEKNKISHRSLAIKQLLEYLERK